MKIALVSVAALLAISGTALAELTSYNGSVTASSSRYTLNRAGTLLEVPSFVNTRGPAFTDIYDNTVTPVAFGGNGTNFLGDNLITTGTGDVRELEFSIGNAGAVVAGTGTLTRLDIGILIYQFDGVSGYNQIYSNNFNDIAMNLPHGNFTTLTLTDPGVSLTQTDIIVAVRLSDPIGTTGTNLFQVRANPVAVGSSDNDLVVGNTTAITGFASFAGTNNNIMYRVAIPAPGSLALLGLGGLAAVRRRR